MTIDWKPGFLATTLGSVPHKDIAKGTALTLQAVPQIPAWVQFPHLHPKESMMIQFTEGMPGLAEEEGRIFFNTQDSRFEQELLAFYETYLAFQGGDAKALETLAISPGYAAGFHELLKQLPSHKSALVAIKGQITGPFTLGTNLTDQDRRPAYYDERLRDIMVKALGMKAVWQIRHLVPFCQRVLIFIDEPSLLGFGSSTFTAVSREDIIHDLNDVAAAIHTEGALAGVHCEANTDWSMLMEANLDILDFDAYDHFQVMTLYPEHLARFLAKGGILGWGIVPTLSQEAAAAETTNTLWERLQGEIAELERRGHKREILLSQAILTPSCGMGGVLTEELAERALGILKELAERLQGVKR